MKGKGQGKGKGKQKVRKQGGRAYAPIEPDDVDELDEPAGAQQTRGKVGLNEYEKALWRWVNVDDLDAFLQEVSCGVFGQAGVPSWTIKLT